MDRSGILDLAKLLDEDTKQLDEYEPEFVRNLKGLAVNEYEIHFSETPPLRGDDLSPLTRCSPDVPKESRNHTILAYCILEGLGGCVYSSKSIEHSSSLLENYSARSSPSLCQI